MMPSATSQPASSAPPKWIELIRVRSSAAAFIAEAPALEAMMTRLAAAATDAETFLLRHGLYEGDRAVVLMWRTAGPPHETAAGLRVAAALRRFGAVDHAVWQPVDRHGPPADRGPAPLYEE